MTSPPPEDRQLLLRLFDAAVRAAAPAHCMPRWLPRRPDGNVVVVGAGKAAASMARVLETCWGGPLKGTVIVPYGHSVDCEFIDVVEAGHPVPDANGVAATRRILDQVSGLSGDDTVICLFSGGGSSLLCAPAPGVTLAEKQAATSALLKSGAPIHEINDARRKLSAVKGGKLAVACAPARIVTLIISDVPGNDPAVVASGPTIAPGTSRLDADIRILATSDDAIQAAALLAMELGLTPHVLGDISGDARTLGEEHARLALQIAAGAGPVQSPCVILSGGETTVKVSGAGRGGRNGEYALALAVALGGHPGISAIACDTDGIDGAGDNAGCIVDAGTLERGRTAGLDPSAIRRDNDSFRFFAQTGDLVMTGPTLTNVNDFRALLVR
jgi:hydroxypyruvate reductase